MRFCVVGGGVAGLTAARALTPYGEVVVLEATSRVGGKLRALDLEGVVLDAGAESVLARRPEAVDLIDELGLSADRVQPTDARPALLVEGEPRPLPASVLGVPTDVAALEGILSRAGWARARAEQAGPALSGDVAIGRLVDERLGPEVTDRLLEPMLGGVYAGRARELSFAAVAPGLFERVRDGGRLTERAAAGHDRGDGGPVFAGLRGGIHRLTDTLAAAVRGRSGVIRTHATVSGLHPAPGGGYRLTLLDGEEMTADAVVLALPATPAGRLLGGLVDGAQAWGELRYASLALVTVVVEGLRGGSGERRSGLLVPPGGMPTIKALTYSSRKWDWVASAAAERWGGAAEVVRVSVGRLGEEALLQLPDEALLQRTFAEAATLPGWERAHLRAGHVTRWGGALPQYAVGHRDRVARLRAGLAAHRGLTACGAALDGVGIAACVASAEQAVAKIKEDFE